MLQDLKVVAVKFGLLRKVRDNYKYPRLTLKHFVCLVVNQKRKDLNTRKTVLSLFQTVKCYFYLFIYLLPESVINFQLPLIKINYSFKGFICGKTKQNKKGWEESHKIHRCVVVNRA